MSPLPMFPNWAGIHPLLIHFPVTLFFLAPVFAFVAAFTKAAVQRTLLVSGLLLMLLGSILLQVSYTAGQAAARAANPIDVQLVVERHGMFADLARSSLTLATLLFGVTLLVCVRLDLRVRELIGALPLGTAVFYGLGLFWLVHTAYEGERLVHEFGVGLIATH